MWILQSSFIIYLQRENFDFRWCINFFLHFFPPLPLHLLIVLFFTFLCPSSCSPYPQCICLSGGIGSLGYCGSGGLWQAETSLLSRHWCHPHVLLHWQPWQLGWVKTTHTHRQTSTCIQAWQGIPHRRLFHVVPHLSVFTKEVISALCRMCGHSVVALNANCRGTAYICTYTQWNFFLSWCLWTALP